MMNERLESSDPLPENIYGYVSIKSIGGLSAFSEDVRGVPNSSKAYHASASDKSNAIHVLERIGFSIFEESDLGLAIAGPAGAYEELTGGKLVAVEILTNAESGIRRYVTHIDVTGGQPPAIGQGSIKSNNTSLEGVFIERPAATNQYRFPTPIPPAVNRYHLRLPDDVALGLNASHAHRAGYTGRGIRVAMVDTGQYPHPFFDAHGYEVLRTITVVKGTDPAEDPAGHGTAESANIFAVAPDAVLQPIRASNNEGKLVGASGGFLRAKRLKPNIMTNSWGRNEDYPAVGPLTPVHVAWALEILDAVEKGIVVVFSAGNGTFALESQIPGIISAGGAFMHIGMEFRASDFSSGYSSPWFEGRDVPDVAGLVGMQPRAQYLMLPAPPSSWVDQFYGQPNPPADFDSDRTLPSDGWALASGTSAAAPQIAGAAAVILSAVHGLSPRQVLDALRQTARDVRTGRCHPIFNFSAQAGPDLATGYGVVDVHAAVNYAIEKYGESVSEAPSLKGLPASG